MQKLKTPQLTTDTTVTMKRINLLNKRVKIKNNDVLDGTT